MKMYYKLYKGIDSTFVTKAGNNITITDRGNGEYAIHAKINKDGDVVREYGLKLTMVEDGDVIKFDARRPDEHVLTYCKAPKNPIKKIFFSKLGLTGKVYRNEQDIKKKKQLNNNNTIIKINDSTVIKKLSYEIINEDTGEHCITVLYEMVLEMHDGMSYAKTLNVTDVYCDYTICTDEMAHVVTNHLCTLRKKAYENRQMMGLTK